MKKEKTRSHVVRNTFLYSVLVVGIIFAALVSPWEELQTSLIESANTSQEDILDSLQSINVALRTMQQQEKDRYMLVEDVVGTKSFFIPENTCRNGSKVTAQLDGERGSIQIMGIAANKSRSVYSAVVSLNKETATQVRYLPNSIIIDNDTLFVNYQISKGDSADTVSYSVECY